MTTPSRPLPRRQFVARIAAYFAGIALLGRAKRLEAATQSTEPYLGEIILFAGNFAPRGWALCNGQILPINQNQALFAILGTQYGGDGRVTFALPDLRDRVPIHQGQGPGLSARVVGERAGEATHTLAVTEMPGHTHGARASSGIGSSVSPTNMYLARNAAQIPQYASSGDTVMAPLTIGSTGGGQPHENTQPCLALNFIIALQGVFPSQ